MNGRRTGLALALLTAAFVLAGCGGGSPAASDTSPAASDSPRASATAVPVNPSGLLHRAVRASKKATSVHVRGTGRDDGAKVTVDALIAGHRAALHMRLKRQRFEVIRIRSALYISGNTRFWRASSGQQDVSAFKGRYLKASTHEKDYADLRSLVDIDALFADVARPTGHVTSGGRTTFRGVPAVRLVDESGSTLYVAATGTPYVLGVRNHEERLAFTDYGEPVAIKRPPANRILPY